MVDTSDVYTLMNKNITPIVKPSNATMATKLQCSDKENVFDTMLNSAINSLNTTNMYLSNAENEEIKLALGESDNTHDLAIAMQKASTALQYTVAVRDKFLEAYKELMNMQI